MQINKDYPCKETNYRKGRRDSIKYIVIHYVGATGSALDNVKYYGSSNVGASAHYYVGHASENGAIYQSVAPENCAWHCGSETGVYYSPCRNDNAIGIEMCCHLKNGEWYFDDITVEKTIELTKYLMEKYNIPIENVIRHYDVTHKTCPAPFVLDEQKWKEFKKSLEDDSMTTEERLKFNELVKVVANLQTTVDKLTNPMIYNYIDNNMPEWARPTIQKMVDKGILRGNEKGELGLNETMLKIFVTNDRAGLYDK